MKKITFEDLEEWVGKVDEELMQNQSWIDTYNEYAEKMIENQKSYVDGKKFRVRKPLHAYLTIGNVKDKCLSFDLRYLGQSVGTIKIKNQKRLLFVDKDHATNNKTYFSYTMGVVNGVDWNSSKEAKEFRKFFRDESVGTPRQIEHMVESALFSEFEKTKSSEKCLCNITPVDYASTRIHMKSAVKASDSKKNILSVSETGGEVDILCRRSVKAGRGESRLVVIEVKDENKSNESFDMAMKQALSYAVFIRRLIYSKAGESWMKLWGMQNQKRSGFVIDCAVAMPKGGTKFSFPGKRIGIENERGEMDYFELHFLELLPGSDSENVVFEHSFDKK